MALRIERTNNVGITTTYHKVSHVSINFTDENAHVHAVISHYASQEYREKSVHGNADSSSYIYDYPVKEFTGDVRELIYDSLKATEEYKDAEDV